MGKGYSGKDYFERWKTAHKMADVYGVDASNVRMGVGGGRPGEGGVERESLEDLETKLSGAMTNNYDVRRSLEAADMAGNKKAEKILSGGLNNIEQAYKAHKFMKKTHTNRLEAGGDYGSTNDPMNVSNYWVNKDREKMLKPLAQTKDLNKLKDKLLEEALGDKNAQDDASNPAEPSDRLAQAHARIGAAAHDPTSLYQKNNQDAAKADDQADGARNFLTEYKVDVTKGAGLRDDIKSNLSNASNTVTDVFGR